MQINVACPKCGKRLKAPASLAGKRAKCSGCGGVIPIPAAQAKPGPSLSPGIELEGTAGPARSSAGGSLQPDRKPARDPLALDPSPSSDVGPLDLLTDDLIEPELPPSALVAHPGEAPPPPGKTRGRPREAATIPGNTSGAGGGGSRTSAYMQAAARDHRLAQGEGPQPWFSLMGIDFTPVKAVVLLVFLLLVGGAGLWWFTGPGRGLYIAEMKPVAVFMPLQNLSREEIKMMPGATPINPYPGPLGKKFPNVIYNVGGGERLIFTRPDAQGDYLLVHVRISQRVMADEKLENRYDMSFAAQNYILHVGQEQITPMLMAARIDESTLNLPVGDSKSDSVYNMLPHGVKPDEFKDLRGTEDEVASGMLVYNGTAGVTGQVEVSASRLLIDLPGVSGVNGDGELVQQDAVSGMSLRYTYQYGDMTLSWNGPAAAWWSADQYLLPEAISPWSKFDVYLLYPRPQNSAAGDMEIRLNNRVVGKIPAAMAAQPGQKPSAVTVAAPPSAPTPGTPGGPGSPGGPADPDDDEDDDDSDSPANASGAASTQPGRKQADPGVFDYFGALARARKMGQGVAVESNMRQIGTGVLMYAEKYNGALPPTLDHVRDVLGDINPLLHNVRTGDRPGFLYIRPAENMNQVANPAGTPILYETKDGKLDRQGAVMYLDGRLDPPSH